MVLFWAYNLGYLKQRVRTYQMAPTLPLDSAEFFLSSHLSPMIEISSFFV